MKALGAVSLFAVLFFSGSGFASDRSQGSLSSEASRFRDDDGAKLFMRSDLTQRAWASDQAPPEEGLPEDPPACDDNYFDWGTGRDGTGYCYEFFRSGEVANQGRSLPNRFCERVSPSYYEMGRSRDGGFYCYQFSPYHVVLNQGRAVPPSFCR